MENSENKINVYSLKIGDNLRISDNLRIEDSYCSKNGSHRSKNGSYRLKDKLMNCVGFIPVY